MRGRVEPSTRGNRTCLNIMEYKALDAVQEGRGTMADGEPRAIGLTSMTVTHVIAETNYWK